MINGVGEGKVEPDGTLTWAQAMKLLLCAHGDLEDVTGSRWAEAAMGKASELGLCDSSQKGTSEISRLQFCRTATKLFSVDSTAGRFSDCADASVLALAGAGIISGYPDGSFSPDKTITRAEISKVVYLLMRLSTTPADYTTQIDAPTPAEQSQTSAGDSSVPQSQEPGNSTGVPQAQIPGNRFGIPQSGIPTGGMGGQQPGQQTTLNSAESPSEVVSGTMTNSAASLEVDYDNATYITVTDDDSQVTISSSGTYVVSGSSTDGNITVEKGTTGVILVLRDLDLTSTTGATVSINKEAEVKIIIDGNVVLTDNENPEDENSTDADVADAFDGAALKAKANSQVYVTGDGTLTINGNAKNGVKGGDDASIIFDGVTVNISAVNDGINVNYDVTLLSGNFTISTGDDAIHADHILTIGDTDGTGPVIRVTSSTEGLEGTVVNINGGDVSIVSSDDAVNAANGDGLYEGTLDYSFNMLGGQLAINCTGDGIDSNGNVNLIDGSAQINSGSIGGEAGIDCDGQFYISDEFNLNNQSGMVSNGQIPGQGFGGMNGQQPGASNTINP